MTRTKTLMIVAVLCFSSGCAGSSLFGGSIPRADYCAQSVDAYLASPGYERALLFSEMDDRCQTITMEACRGELTIGGDQALSHHR